MQFHPHYGGLLEAPIGQAAYPCVHAQPPQALTHRQRCQRCGTCGHREVCELHFAPLQ